MRGHDLVTAGIIYCNPFRSGVGPNAMRNVTRLGPHGVGHGHAHFRVTFQQTLTVKRTGRYLLLAMPNTSTTSSRDVFLPYFIFILSTCGKSNSVGGRVFSVTHSVGTESRGADRKMVRPNISYLFSQYYDYFASSYYIRNIYIIGTAKDSIKLRDRIHSSEQSTNYLIKETAQAFHQYAQVKISHCTLL